MFQTTSVSLIYGSASHSKEIYKTQLKLSTVNQMENNGENGDREGPGGTGRGLGIGLSLSIIPLRLQ